jgi:DNA-binding MarR family transcriptional regulator
MAPVTDPRSTTALDDEVLADTAARLRLGATRLARRLRQQSETDLTPTQLAALATIDRCGPLPVGALAAAEQVAAPTATKVVDKLVAAGLVARRPDPADGRVSLLSLTGAGAALLGEIRARRTAWLVTRLGGLSPAELESLRDALEVLERLVDAEAGR